MSAIPPTYQPKYRWLSVPSRSGPGGTPEWVTTGRVGSDRSARATDRSSTSLFQLGSRIEARLRHFVAAVAPSDSDGPG